MKIGLLPIVTLMTVLCLSQALQGQQDKRIAAAKKRVTNYLNQMKSSSENRLAVVLEDIDRICQLDESQTKKLRFAAKGAVSKYVAKLEKQQNDMYRRQFGDKWDEDENEEETDKPEENRFQPARGAVMFERVAWVGRQQNYAVENEKIWKDNIKKVLSEEQTKKYDEALKERNEFRRNAAVNTFIAQIDRQLLLTKSQRELITKLIDQKYGEKIAAQNAQMGLVVFGGRGRNNQKSPIDHKLLTGFTKNQLETWKTVVEPKLLNLERMAVRVGGGALNQQILLQPAVAPAAVQIEIAEDPPAVKEKPVKKPKVEKPKKDDKKQR